MPSETSRDNIPCQNEVVASWDLLLKEKCTVNPTTVSRGTSYGMRTEWVYDFVAADTFQKVLKKDISTKGLPMKIMQLRDPFGNLVKGMLAKPNTVPTVVPCAKVILYSDNTAFMSEELLDSLGLLHGEHAPNVLAWRIAQDVKDSGVGRSLDSVIAPFTWEEI
jgi:hypothetical protein